MPLVNHFTLGADPEFVLRKDGQYIHAAHLALGVEGCYGADGSGRQAELRPRPHRSALWVTASIRRAMQTMQQSNATAAGATWHAPPIQRRSGETYDGCGGHVHFGRLRFIGDRRLEWRRLDNLCAQWLIPNWLDTSGLERRREVTRYGCPRDVREQTYGYEYRTLNTWVNSPEQAFITLVTAKLAVLYKTPRNGAPAGLHKLFEDFAPLDSDARLALKVLKRAPQANFVYDDFRPRWGVGPHVPDMRLPETAAPNKEDVDDMRMALMTGAPFPTRPARLIPAPLWRWDDRYQTVCALGIPLQGRTAKVAGIAPHVWKCLPPTLANLLQTAWPDIQKNAPADCDVTLPASSLASYLFDERHDWKLTWTVPKVTIQLRDRRVLHVRNRGNSAV